MGQRKKREGHGISFKQPPLAETTQNQPKTVPAMGWLFGTRFSCGGMFGNDDYPLLWMVIRATKNKMKKYTLWLYITTKQ
jgi:hypothetical protein